MDKLSFPFYSQYENQEPSRFSRYHARCAKTCAELKKTLENGTAFLNQTPFALELNLKKKRKAFLGFLLDICGFSFQSKYRNFLELKTFLLNSSLLFIFLEYVQLKVDIYNNLKKFLNKKLNDFFIIANVFFLNNITLYKNKAYLYFLFKTQIKFIILEFKLKSLFYAISNNKFYLGFLALLASFNLIIALINTFFQLCGFLRVALVWFVIFNKLIKKLKTKKLKVNKILLIKLVLGFGSFLFEIIRFILSYKFLSHFISCYFKSNIIVLGG